MGASTCKSCGVGQGTSLDFDGAPPPRGEADHYQVDSGPGPDNLYDPLAAEHQAKGDGYSQSKFEPEVGAAGGVGRDLAASCEIAADEGTSESYWTSYFASEDKELRSVADATGALVKSRRRHTFRTNAVYDGEWLGNERSGFGIQTWPDGAVYEGQWKQNKAWGQGRFRHCDGDVYTGQWRQNMAHGFGVYLHRDGTTYAGDFLDDLQDGVGIECWSDQSQFTGKFTRGKKSGHGIYTWPDKSSYQGQWVGNHIDGHGVYIGADGRRFEGLWKASAMHGCGRYQWPDGRIYAGQYVADQKDGFGTFTWADGRRYEGFWWKGNQHGQGRLCHESSNGVEVRVAEWAHGERVRWIDSERPGGDRWAVGS